MIGTTIRRKAKQFGTLVRRSAMTPRTGDTRKPVLASRGELGVTFIGHSSFFLQIGGKNILVDPNFARWIFVLKRLRRPGLRLRDLPPIDAVLVSHAHFDHLHRPSLRAIARLTRWRSGKRPQIIVPRHVRDLVSDLGFGRSSSWTGGRAASSAVSRSRTCRRGIGALASCATCIVATADTSCGRASSRIYHAGDTAYFDGFREIGAAPASPSWRCCRSAPIIPASYRNGAHQPGRRGAGFRRPGRALDGAHALRNVSPVVRAGGRAGKALEDRSQAARHREERFACWKRA